VSNPDSEPPEDVSHLIANASEHISWARTHLESAADSAPAYEQTRLLLEVASRFSPLADAVSKLAAAFMGRSI